MSEKTHEEALTIEREDAATLASIATNYIDVDVKRGFGRAQETVKLRIRRPTMAEQNGAIRFGKSQFIECVKAGLPTRAQAMDAAKQAGLWTEAQEDRMGEISNKISELIEEQSSTENKARKAKLREKIRELKKEQIKIAAVFSEIIANTIEQVQDNANQSFLVCKCVSLLNGESETPLYPSLEDMNNETDIKFIERVANYATSFWLGDSVTDFFTLGELPDDETSDQGTK